MELCRHCHKKKASRARQLCWRCYYAPGVRELYPMNTKPRHLPSPVKDYCGTSKSPLSPTAARPGTAEKVDVLADRAMAGLSLWHRGDAPMDDETEHLKASVKDMPCY